MILDLACKCGTIDNIGVLAQLLQNMLNFRIVPV
jgi:hypothetical protein